MEVMQTGGPYAGRRSALFAWIATSMPDRQVSGARSIDVYAGGERSARSRQQPVHRRIGPARMSLGGRDSYRLIKLPRINMLASSTGLCTPRCTPIETALASVCQFQNWSHIFGAWLSRAIRLSTVTSLFANQVLLHSDQTNSVVLIWGAKAAH